MDGWGEIFYQKKQQVMYSREILQSNNEYIIQYNVYAHDPEIVQTTGIPWSFRVYPMRPTEQRIEGDFIAKEQNKVEKKILKLIFANERKLIKKLKAMKRLVLLILFMVPFICSAQDIRKNEGGIKETSIEALTKGFIYRFRSTPDKKYIEVRIQKHGSFRVAEGDTLIMHLADGSEVRGIAVRGGQGDVPYRPKSPGIKSLWSLFTIDPSLLTASPVVSARIAAKDQIIGFDEPLVFDRIKKQPAQMLMKAATLIK